MIVRTVTYAIIAALALFVLATMFVFDHGGGSATPDVDGTISIHDLSMTPERYFGETVTTEGILNFSEQTQRYQVVDEGLAVVITGYEVEALAAMSSRPVVVTGTFNNDPGLGIFIDADTVQAVD